MCCGITLASRRKLIYCILKFNPCLPEDNKKTSLWGASDASLEDNKERNLWGASDASLEDNKERNLWGASDASLDSLSLLVTEFRFDAMLCYVMKILMWVILINHAGRRFPPIDQCPLKLYLNHLTKQRRGCQKNSVWQLKFCRCKSNVTFL